MAEYKQLWHTAEEVDNILSSAQTHNGDTTTHVTAADKQRWNAAAVATETMPEEYREKGVVLYAGTDDVQSVDVDTSPYNYLQIAICNSAAGYWYYANVNKAQTTIPICRLSGDVMQVGRVNCTVSASNVTISEFSGFGLTTSGVSEATVPFRIRRIVGFYV